MPLPRSRGRPCSSDGCSAAPVPSSSTQATEQSIRKTGVQKKRLNFILPGDGPDGMDMDSSAGWTGHAGESVGAVRGRGSHQSPKHCVRQVRCGASPCLQSRSARCRPAVACLALLTTRGALARRLCRVPNTYLCDAVPVGFKGRRARDARCALAAPWCKHAVTGYSTFQRVSGRFQHVAPCCSPPAACHTILQPARTACHRRSRQMSPSAQRAQAHALGRAQEASRCLLCRSTPAGFAGMGRLLSGQRQRADAVDVYR